MKNQKRTGKDPITVGIFTAIYFVVMFAVAMPGDIPVLMALLCVIVPVIGGIPFMRFLSKEKKRKDLDHKYSQGGF